jgi:hypothetical protein
MDREAKLRDAPRQSTCSASWRNEALYDAAVTDADAGLSPLHALASTQLAAASGSAST